eukprot:3937212-Rhodomonas_salina.1
MCIRDSTDTDAPCSGSKSSVCCATCGTERACAAIIGAAWSVARLHTSRRWYHALSSYALSGTDIVYGAIWMRVTDRWYQPLSPYALATRCPVLTQCMLRRCTEIAYGGTVCGTAIAYATRCTVLG